MTSKESLQKIVSDLEHLSSNFPSITSIRPQSCGESPINFKVNYLQANYRESSFHNVTHHFSFDPKAKDSPIKKLTDFPSIEGFLIAESFSPSRNFRAFIRPGLDRTLLEIWGKNGLQRSVRVSDFHGSIYSDLELTIDALSWSQDENRIVYLAEKRPNRPSHLFNQFKTDEEAQGALKNYEYSEDFGENMRGKCFPYMFVYDLLEDQLYEVLNVPDHALPTQVSFADNSGQSLIFCGYHLKEFRLGLKYCSNRECKVFRIVKLALRGLKSKITTSETLKSQEEDLKKVLETYKATVISEDEISVAPIVSPDLSKVVYFYSPKKRTILVHFGLKMINLSTKEEPVQKEKTETIFEMLNNSEDNFYGATTYQNRLTRARFLSNSKLFVFNSYSRSSLGLFIVHLETKEVRRIDKTPFKSGECRLDTVEGNLVFASLSNVIGERTFAILNGINSSAETLDEVLKDMKWFYYDLNPEKAFQISGKIDSTLNNIEVDEKIIQVNGMESIYFSLKNSANKKRPLLAFLHGGPHGISTGFYSAIMYYALYKGYNVLYPNFSGSTGFGQESTEKLLGKIGQLDAQEVKDTMEHLIQKASRAFKACSFDAGAPQVGTRDHCYDMSWHMY